MSALTATLAACGSSNSAGTGSRGLEKTRLTVAVVPATAVAGLYIAQQRGYFTAAGLHVKIEPVISSSSALADLSNGSIDIDEGQYTSYIDAVAAGVPLHILAPAGSGGTGLDEVVIPKTSPYTTPQQLRGKTIAVNALDGLAELLTENVLLANGVPAAQVHFVVVPFPAMEAALAAHRVDAAYMPEPYLSAAVNGDGDQKLFDINQGAAQDFPITGFAVTKQWVRKYPRTAAAFIRALERGQQVASVTRAAVEETLTRVLKISRGTAATMAVGGYPETISASDIERVGVLMQEEHMLKPHSANVAKLAQEMTG